MSRSYKKHPCGGDTKSRFGKRYANHVVRKYFDIGNHGYYKKLFNSYNICDYWSYYPWTDYKEFMNSLHVSVRRYGHNKSEKELYNDWADCYRRK